MTMAADKVQQVMSILCITEVTEKNVDALRESVAYVVAGDLATPRGRKAIKSVIDNMLKGTPTPEPEPAPVHEEPAQIPTPTPAPAPAPKPAGVVRHEKFDECKEMIECGLIPYIYGPAGTGKTRFAQDIAKELGMEFYMTGSVQMVHELIGFVDANGNYNDTPFYHALTEGGMFLFDEIDGSSPEALTAINSVLANRTLAIPKFGVVKAHENFRMIAAGNTKGTGPDDMYCSRVQLDAATLDRFVLEEFDYSENIEMMLAKDDRELVEFVHDLRKAVKMCDAKYVVSYRGIEKFVTLSNLKAFQSRPEHALCKSFMEQMNDDDAMVIASNLSKLSNKYVRMVRRAYM